MRFLLTVFLLSSASIALANPAPEITPAPDWVKRVKLNLPTTTTDAPVRFVLIDQQNDLTPGAISRFSEVAAKVQTMAGLSAGNISMSWRPDVDTLMVHALTVLRHGKLIDVLATQKFTIIRRETNLEQASLDGRLTASLLIDGMEVGDVVDLATTIVTRDPTMAGHVEAMTAQWNGIAIDHAHARLHWTKDVSLHLQPSPGLPAAPTLDDARGKSIELSADNVQPIIAPKNAPARFMLGRLLEATDYRSWADVGTLMSPLYVKASAIDPKGALAAQIAQIRAAHADPLARASAALDLAQSRIRYVALQMGTGGYVPAAADATWASRFGDCKAKTALLLAMLHRLDIVAVPVLVSAAGGDAVGTRLPMVGLFDHVLVRATIKGRDYWLDGTRVGDTDVDRLEVPAFGFALPVVATGAQLTKIVPLPRSEPDTEFALAIDARDGAFAPAKAHVDVTYRGDGGQLLKLTLAAMPDANREATLRDFFRSTYDFIEPATVSSSFDPATRTERISMDGSAKLKWKDNWLRIPGSGLAYAPDFSRPAGPNHDAPFDTDFPAYERDVSTIKLPPGITLWAGTVGHDVHQTLAGVEYHREATLKDNVLHMMKSERTIAPEIDAAIARAAQARIRTINDEDVHLDNSSYSGGGADLVALKATTPDTATAFIRRGLMLLASEEWAQAVVDFTAAYDLAPNNMWTLADRAIAYALNNETAKAQADLAVVDAKAPGNPVADRTRGVLAYRRGDMQGAIDAYTASLKIQPDDRFALLRRAEVNRGLHRYDAALADTDGLLRLSPIDSEVRLLRVNIFIGQGKPQLALAEADTILRGSPDDSFAQTAAAQTYAGLGKTDRAMAIMDAAITRKPDVMLYVNRIRMRDRKDIVGRRADLDAAIKLDPQDVDVLTVKAVFLIEQQDYRGAIALYSALLEKQPNEGSALIGRGVAFAKSGDDPAAQRDFAAYRVANPSASGANSLCWQKAVANVALASALDDCNRAVKGQPSNASYYDSRGFTHLRMGRLDEAIADLDAALKISPNRGASLYTRSMAWARKGDLAKASADRAAAEAISPKIADRYAAYGIESPTAVKH